jgi:hypothetical protein
MRVCEIKGAGSSCPTTRTEGNVNRTPSQAMVYFVLCSATVFSVLYVWTLYRATQQSQLSFFVISLLVFKTLVEVCASYYGFAFLFIAFAYLLRREPPCDLKPVPQPPPVGIIYLCCGDLDRAALFSLATLAYRGKICARLCSDPLENFRFVFAASFSSYCAQDSESPVVFLSELIHPLDATMQHFNPLFLCSAR